MKPQQTRRCRHCGRRFEADHRNVHRQRYCSAVGCQEVSKRASQRRWFLKPDNRSHFCGANEVRRVREWRRAHPGYWRNRRGRCPGACVDNKPPSEATPPVPGGSTLQDLCHSQTSVLTGLISRLSGCTLQEDIASCAKELVTVGRWMLAQCQSGTWVPVTAGAPANYHESS